MTTPTAPAPAAPAPAAATEPICDATLWDHVYNPQRLQIVQSCARATGIVDEVRDEKDGDKHILVHVDPAFDFMVNSVNRAKQNGDLIVEPICVTQPVQPDAIQPCMGYTNQVPIPTVGAHVEVIGSYVLDNQHGAWAELHPVTSIRRA